MATKGALSRSTSKSCHPKTCALKLPGFYIVFFSKTSAGGYLALEVLLEAGAWLMRTCSWSDRRSSAQRGAFLKITRPVNEQISKSFQRSLNDDCFVFFFLVCRFVGLLTGLLWAFWSPFGSFSEEEMFCLLHSLIWIGGLDWIGCIG